MYCEICKTLEPKDAGELLTFSAQAHAHLVSILKISKNNSADKINDGIVSSISICIKCLQGF